MAATRQVLRTMPETVKIGAKAIDVRVQDNLVAGKDRYMGLADWSGAEIALEGRQSSHELVNTLVHEILHLHCKRGAIQDIEEIHKYEEFIVNLMSNVFCEMVMENPALMKWIVNTLRQSDEGRDRMRKYGKERQKEGGDE